MSHKSKEIAIGGISAAMCLVVMFMTGLLPFSTYALPSLAGFMLIPITCEMGLSCALVVYTAASFLALFISPDLEATIMFISFLGYYPIMRSRFERIKSTFIKWIAKFATFNTAMIIAYQIIIRIFGMTAILSDGGFIGEYLPYVMLAVGNMIFILYDFCIKTLYIAYNLILRKKLFRPNR